MSRFRSQRLTSLILRIPGVKTFGPWPVIPFCFFSGAALEYVMINWHFGESKINFYKTFKRRQAKEQAEAIVKKYLARKAAEQF